MPEQIISHSGTQYGLIVNPDGSINAQTDNQLPNQGNNPAYQFSYDSYGNVGSIIQFIDSGSYVQTLTWANGSVLTAIGSYS